MLQWIHYFRTSPISIALLSLTIGCGADTEYDATLAEISESVRLEIHPDAENVVLARHFSHEGFGWEHCPVIRARATLNGVDLELTESGGWVEPAGDLLSSSGGYCRSMRFAPPHGQRVDWTNIDLRIEDRSGAIEFEALAIFGAEQLTVQDVLMPGEQAVLEIAPDGALHEEDACAVAYQGVRMDATPAAARDTFAADVALDGGTASFLVPETFDSAGTLRLDCRWPLNVQVCEGVGGCYVSRDVQVPVTDAQVSATGESLIAPKDPLNWSGCGILVDGAKLELSGCSGSANSSTGAVRHEWTPLGDNRSFGFAVVLQSLDVGTEFSAPLTWSPSRPGETISEVCDFVVQEHWPGAIGAPGVIQGIASCSSPIADFPFDPREFVFRGTAGVNEGAMDEDADISE